MKINCFFTYKQIPSNSLQNSIAVVIDVLRATSSIITALDYGAASVMPCAEVGIALRKKEQNPLLILTGERKGKRLEGFDLGNSPFEFMAASLKGKPLLSCTTNGTKAIMAAISAQELWLAALLNAQAVAYKLLKQPCTHATIICAGTDDQVSMDDIMVAGAIIHYIANEQPLETDDLNDSAIITRKLYESYRDMDMHQVLLLTQHGRKLTRLGHGEDVRYCAQQNITATVPVLDYHSMHIRLPSDLR